MESSQKLGAPYIDFSLREKVTNSQARDMPSRIPTSKVIAGICDPRDVLSKADIDLSRTLDLPTRENRSERQARDELPKNLFVMASAKDVSTNAGIAHSSTLEASTSMLHKGNKSEHGQTAGQALQTSTSIQYKDGRLSKEVHPKTGEEMLAKVQVETVELHVAFRDLVQSIEKNSTSLMQFLVDTKKISKGTTFSSLTSDMTRFMLKEEQMKAQSEQEKGKSIKLLLLL